MLLPAAVLDVEGLLVYAGTCDHLYANCPFKNDPEVWEEYGKGLQKAREERRRYQGGRPTSIQRSTATTAISDWKEQGYPSEAVASLIATAASNDTNANACCAVIKELGVKLARSRRDPMDRDNEDAPPTNWIRTDGGTSNIPSAPVLARGTGPVTFCICTIPVINAKVVKWMEEQLKNYDIPINPGSKQYPAFSPRVTSPLPFTRLPIGNRKREITVEVMVDTGASITCSAVEYTRQLLTHLSQQMYNQNTLRHRSLLRVPTIHNLRVAILSEIASMPREVFWDALVKLSV